MDPVLIRRSDGQRFSLLWPPCLDGSRDLHGVDPPHEAVCVAGVRLTVEFSDPRYGIPICDQCRSDIDVGTQCVRCAHAAPPHT